MDFDEYQKQSRITAKYNEADDTFTYPLLGLVGEAGEVADKVKKHMRDDGKYHPSELNEEQKRELAKELGDVLWYLAQLSTELGYSLSEVAKMNIEKTHSRMDRGKLSGSGDNR
jgi:NTP pyrophosphatase (non-canonical NTP hydrolase)